MVEGLNFVVAPLLLAAFGLPAAFDPRVRNAGLLVRTSLSFMVGVVVFVVWETLLSIADVEWSFASVVLPLLIVSAAATFWLTRQDHGSIGEGGVRLSGVALGVGLVGLGHLALSAATSRATSADYYFFWAVKAIRFAEVNGIDPAYLGHPLSVHMHANYPPLVPLVFGWSIDLSGRMSWQFGLLTVVMWIALAFPIVLVGLRSRLPDGEAVLASGFWLLAMSLAISESKSAGNAEAPLVYFLSVGLVALLAREGTFPGWIAPVALAGMMLTKIEGSVLLVLIAGGLGLGFIVDRRPIREIARRLSGIVVAPVAVSGVWVAYELRWGLPLGDATRESAGDMSFSNFGTAVTQSLRYMEAGSGWIAWGLAIVMIVLSWRHWREALPALAVAAGILGFLLVYYLHYQGDDLERWIRWTFSRVSLTALSAAILAAAVMSGGEGEGDSSLTLRSSA